MFRSSLPQDGNGIQRFESYSRVINSNGQRLEASAVGHSPNACNPQGSFYEKTSKNGRVTSERHGTWSDAPLQARQPRGGIAPFSALDPFGFFFGPAERFTPVRSHLPSSHKPRNERDLPRFTRQEGNWITVGRGGKFVRKGKEWSREGGKPLYTVHRNDLTQAERGHLDDYGHLPPSADRRFMPKEENSQMPLSSQVKGRSSFRDFNDLRSMTFVPEIDRHGNISAFKQVTGQNWGPFYLVPQHDGLQSVWADDIRNAEYL